MEKGWLIEDVTNQFINMIHMHSRAPMASDFAPSFEMQDSILQKVTERYDNLTPVPPGFPRCRVGGIFLNLYQHEQLRLGRSQKQVQRAMTEIYAAAQEKQSLRYHAAIANQKPLEAMSQVIEGSPPQKRMKWINSIREILFSNLKVGDRASLPVDGAANEIHSCEPMLMAIDRQTPDPSPSSWNHLISIHRVVPR